MSSTLKILKKLVAPLSVSGREDAVRGVIAEEIAPIADSVTVDAMGNLIAFMAGTSENKKKLMYAAHMDEIGFIVTYIEENGFIRFAQIGGINYTAAAFTHVVFENGTRGVLVPESGVAPADIKAEKCVVDIGASSKREVEKYVSIGDTFAVQSDLKKLLGSRYCGRPIDDRVGAAIMIESARRLKDAGGPKNDLYLAFTTQEEVGLRGSKTAAYAIGADVGIAFDVTGTGDTVSAKPMAVSLGGGAAIKIKDSSVVCDRDLVNKIKKTAEEGGVKYQLEILTAGGTDTASMQQAAGGAVAGCISIPTRYIHSSVECVDMRDVEACVKLACLMANAEF